ncbi:eCIS core domain-containing protein, partial [Parasphingorhabdus sp.]|uniref:eCIS core domain-containing protein n=1 Tax=Parasphingorhabdus sp. TaxID=2709688 RepID=UPI003C75BE3E
MAVAAKIARSQTDAKASTKQPRQARGKRAKSAAQSTATVHRKPLGDEEANRRSGLLAGGAGVQRKALPEEEQVQRKALPDEEKVQRKALPEEEQVQRKALPEEEKIQRKVIPEEEKIQRKPEDYLDDKKKAQVAAAGKNIQAASFISSPEDASEREADRVADAVTAPRAAGSPPVGRSIMRASRKDAGGEGPPVAAANDNVEAKIKAAAVGGKPLSKKTRALLEPRFGADFGEVRIHDDDQAGKLSSRIGARAFTYGRHVFFNAGQYQPDTPSGQKLLAHELTHTIQQRAAVQRKYDGLTSGPKVSESTGTQASRLGISDALDYFADAAYNIPGYRMFTIMIGINPINMREVEATTANILRAIVEFLPGGGLITTVLDQWGIFETVGTWVDEQLKTLGISGTSTKAALDEFIDSLGWSDIFDLGGVWDRAVSIFSTPIDRVIAFIGSLFTQILEFVQQAVLAPLAALVSETEGYALLTQILGFDPITGEPVERTAEGIVGGLLTLAGQEELWNNIQEANALDRIWEWFGTALDSLIALVMGIPDRFIEALATIEITEFLDLPAAIVKVLGVFANIVIDFGAWILETVFTLLTIIIDVVAPGLMGY